MSESLEILFTSHKSPKERDERLRVGLERLGHEVVVASSPISHPLISRSTLRDRMVSSTWPVVLSYLTIWVVATNLLYALAFIREVRGVRNADVIYVMNSADYSVYAASIFGVIFRKPVYFDPHGGLYYAYAEGRKIVDSDSIIARCLRILDKVGAKVCDVYILGSEEFKRELASEFSIPEEKVCVIYTGADESRFNPNREDDETDVDVLYWGTFIPFHGLEILLQAATDLSSDITIGLIGRTYGEQSEQYLERLKNTKQRNDLDNVRFLGSVSQPELCRQIRAADLVAGYLTDNKYLGMTISNKVGEAAYMGKPVLNYGSPAVSEVFSHGESMIFCESTSPEKVTELIESYFDGEYRELGDGARESYDEYLSAEASATRLLTHQRERAPGAS